MRIVVVLIAGATTLHAAKLIFPLHEFLPAFHTDLYRFVVQQASGIGVDVHELATQAVAFLAVRTALRALFSLQAKLA